MDQQPSSSSWSVFNVIAHGPLSWERNQRVGGETLSFIFPFVDSLFMRLESSYTFYFVLLISLAEMWF